MLGENVIEKNLLPRARTIKTRTRITTKRIHLKAKRKNEIRLEHLKEVLSEIPEINESIHVVSSGNFDFWTYIPHLLSLIETADELFLSTWTMSRDVVLQIFDSFDSGKLKAVSVLTGVYFKKRETAVYSTLLNGIIERGQRYVAFKNHAKIMLLSNEADNIYLVIEGSANLTANPRTEQFILTRSRELYDFHRGWMSEMLEKGNQGGYPN